MPVLNLSALRGGSSSSRSSSTSSRSSERAARARSAQGKRNKSGGQDARSKSKTNFWDFVENMASQAVSATEDATNAVANAVKGTAQAVGSVGQSAVDAWEHWSDNRTQVKIAKVEAGSTAGDLLLEGASVAANFLGTTTQQVLDFVTQNPELVQVALTAAGIPVPVGAGASALTSALQSLGAASQEVSEAQATGSAPASLAKAGFTPGQLGMKGGGRTSPYLVYGAATAGGLALLAAVYAVAKSGQQAAPAPVRRHAPDLTDYL